MTQLKLVTYGFVPLLSLVVAGCAHTESKSATAKGLSGYVQQGANSDIVRTGTNECLHSGTWSRDATIQQCDPQRVARAAPQPQPAQSAQTGELPPPVSAQAVEVPADPEPVAQPRTEERIVLGADTYFDFNQATLRPQAQATLDKIASRAKQADELSIEIVGHADQIGNDDYNLTLSQRRADAVRAYFIDQGVAADAIRVEARGETDPVVRCEGRQGAELVSCLQPNRRSEVVFSALEASEDQ